MKILALELSSPQRSAAFVDTAGGAPVVHEVMEAAPGPVLSLAMVEKVLRAANVEREAIEVLAVGLGPGSYTGIRGAIAVAQGWQLARAVKLLGLGSAECLAHQAQAEQVRGRISVVIDAQRDELYLAGYELGAEDCRATEPLRLATLAEARAREQAGDVLIGPEVTRWFPGGRTIFPRAGMLGLLAARRNDFVSGESIEPIYLRATAFVKAPPSRAI